MIKFKNVNNIFWHLKNPLRWSPIGSYRKTLTWRVDYAKYKCKKNSKKKSES